MGNDAIERLAMDVRRGAGFADDEVALIDRVVLHWLGQDIRRVRDMTGPAALVRVGGRWRVDVRWTAKDPVFACGHEVGHWAFSELARMRFATHAEEELACNAFAAVLLAPEKLMTRAYGFFGERVAPIAAGLGLSQTAVVLRLGEVRGDDRAVVTRTEFVHLRGPTLTRERALAGARGDVPGLKKSRLRGGIDEGRVAVRVA